MARIKSAIPHKLKRMTMGKRFQTISQSISQCSGCQIGFFGF